MSPPTGTGNHGANALPVRGNVQVEAPEGPHRRAPGRRAEDREGCQLELELKFVINPDPTPVVKLKIPKKPGPQKSLQEVAAARSTENLRRDKKRKSEGTVRPFCGSTKGPIRFVLPQKGETKGKLMTKNRILVSREHDTMSRGEGEGGGKAGRA